MSATQVTPPSPSPAGSDPERTVAGIVPPEQDQGPEGCQAPLTDARRAEVRKILSKRARKEWLRYDSSFAKWGMCWGIGTAGHAARLLGKMDKAYRCFAMVHNLHASRFQSNWMTATVRRDVANIDKPGSRFAEMLRRFSREHRDGAAAYFQDNPLMLFRRRALVLKRHQPNEKGVLFLEYSYVFPVFMANFDVAKVQERYRIVTGPSWSGYCEPEILCMALAPQPIYKGCTEPVDIRFMERIESRVKPVPIAANWWLDYRVFQPEPEIEKDADFVMVANWSEFKRHEKVFAAMAKLKERGREVKAILAGYGDKEGQRLIRDFAKYFGVTEQCEWYHHVEPDQVRYLVNRAKVKILWSRKEGFNRAIIEAMLMDVPVIMRQDHNFGHHYEHINEKTGRFANEDTLPDVLLDMIDRPEQFSPRAWVLEHMSFDAATRILNEHLQAAAKAEGEAWTEDAVPAVSFLNTVNYVDEAIAEKFADDYVYLEGTVTGGKATERRSDEATEGA